MILTVLATALATALPPADFPHGGSGTHAEVEKSFGADVSIGYAHGRVSSPWIDDGAFGAIVGRYDVFAQSRESTGPRIGASIWASQTMGKQAYGSEPIANGRTRTVAMNMSHYGAMTVIRHAPEAPLSGNFGFGFGRATIDNYFEGPLALPVLSFEAGVRQKLPRYAFIDWMTRAHWSTARNTTNSQLDEWWMIQVAVLFGIHAN